MDANRNQVEVVEGNITVRYELAAAIDFGTTNSAVAFSYENQKSAIHCVESWPDGTTAGKVPTAILFDQNKEFVQFGHGAIKKYQELAAEEQHQDYYFFEKFKMVLYDEEKIKEEITLTDAYGNKMKAMDVFTAAIKFLMNHLFTSINDKHSNEKVDPNTIRWVLTVPAIWCNKAKQFMRKAAEKAGCHPRALFISLEAEAASIYCRTASHEQIRSANHFQKDNGKYLVIDNGGGTLDVTVHELIDNNCLKEVYRVSGGDAGGTKVDQLFIELLQLLFTEGHVENIQRYHPDEWLKIMKEFQRVKKELRPDNLVNYVTIESSKGCPWGKFRFDNLPALEKKGVELRNSGWLSFPKELLQGLVKKVSKDIQNNIGCLLQREELKSLDYIIMVGGFSNSKIVSDDIKELALKYGNIPVIIPEKAELCVVKGAVMFGWKPDIVRIRKSRKTYGIGISDFFREGVHDKKRSYKSKGNKMCKECFHRLVVVNEDIYAEKVVTHPLAHSHKNAQETVINLYETEKNDAIYATEEGVFEVGKIVIPKPKQANGRTILLKLFFGDTEIHVEAKDETSEETYEVKVDFLCERISSC